MKVLHIFVNILLAIAIIFTTSLILVDRTLSAEYLVGVANDTDIYDKLSTSLPQQIARNSGDPKNQQQVLEVLQTSLTPDYLRQKTTDALTQLESALKGNGEKVEIDLEKIRVEAEKRGIEISEDRVLSIKISASDLEQPTKLVQAVEMMKLIFLTAMIILLVASIFLSYWRHTYVGLGAALLVAGIFEGLKLIPLFIAPGVILSQVNFGAQAADLTEVVVDVVNHIAGNLQLQVGVIATLFALLGIVLLVFGKHLPGRKQPEAISSAHPESPDHIMATNKHPNEHQPPVA